MGEVVVARDAGIAILQSSDRLIDFIDFDQPSPSDALRQLVDVGVQATLVLDADGTVLGDALLAAAEHVGLLVADPGLDLDRGLPLTWIERGRLAQHRGKSVGVLEVGKPAVALGLPAGDDIVQLARPDLGQVLVKGHAAIDHDGGPFLEADARGKAIEHGGERVAVLCVAGKDLVRDRKSTRLDSSHLAISYAVFCLKKKYD